jgi:putative FmdB family regulatory protein
MPTYEYKCKECGKVFEVFRRFTDYDKEIKCPNCDSDKAERIFSVPQISGETVTGFSFKDELPPSALGRGMGRGMGRGLGKGPRDGRGAGRGWRRS